MTRGKARRAGRKYQIRKITAYYHALNRELSGNHETIANSNQQYRLTPITIVPRKSNPEDIPHDDPRRRAYESEDKENFVSCDAEFVEKQRKQQREVQLRCSEWVSKTNINI